MAPSTISTLTFLEQYQLSYTIAEWVLSFQVSIWLGDLNAQKGSVVSVVPGWCNLVTKTGQTILSKWHFVHLPVLLPVDEMGRD